MAKEWLKRCCVGAMTAVLTVSSLPMAAFAKEGGVEYSGGAVTVNVDNDTATIGNGAISRTFSFADNHLKTTEINNKRANKKMQPGEGSEEFIIKRTKEDHAYQKPIDQSGWTATADSEENNGEAAPHHGHASNLIDNNSNTFWHTAYKDHPDNKPGNREMPHEIVIDLGKPTSFKSFSYDPRYTNENGSNINGNIKDYTLWVSTAADAPSIDGDHADAGWTEVKKDAFSYEGNKGEAIHVNLNEEEAKKCVDAQCIMLEARTSQNGEKFAGGEEFDLYAEEWVEPTAPTPMLLKSSELILEGAPTHTDTTAVINGKQKTGKKLSFKFQPKEYNGATYSITENVVMYEGDHYMRKFLEISVPQQDALDAEIDYIDLESIDVSAVAKNETWTIPTNKGGIVRMPKERANLGQPFYANAMFFGCEFPATDTQIEEVDGKKIGRPRYYTGKTMDRLAEDNQASRGDDGSIHYNTWQTVVGAARSTDYRVVQADFFDYIDDISVPAEFRIQYNSWYDNEKNISDDNILSSFIEIDKELSETGVRPLDSYVVDDGWTDYTSKDKGFWPFNNKFPKGFDPSSKLVQNFGSNFGVWIGPRGGYGTNGSIADALVAQGMGSKAGGSIDVADRTYLDNYTKFASDFQDKYKVNYWKWDGFADDDQYNHFDGQGGDAKDGVPGRSTTGPTEGHMIGGKNRMYHVTDLWEAWIDLFEAVRANAANNGIENFWISATTYTHPSPWFLQWVNSVWLQCNFDHARTEKGSTVHDGNLNARDACYYNFIEEHQFQFPLSHMYNHDPVYGKSGTAMDAKTATAEQFQNYLYTIAGRGTAFWELYYSDSIFDKEKYEVNAEFLGWVEENFHFLSNARMFGGKSPVEGVTLETSTKSGKPVTLQNTQNSTYNTYGYAGFEGSEGILTVRNANDANAQNLEFTFDDATLGVKGNEGDVFDFVVERHYTKKGTTSSIEDKETHKLGDKITMNLQPEESLTIRVTKANEGDKQGPSIESVTHNGETTDGKTEFIVNMDEKVKGDAKFTVTVNGEEVKVKEVNPSANDATYHIVLEKAPKQDDKIKVTVSGITDMAGNAITNGTYEFDFHENNLVASRCPSRLTTYTKKLAKEKDSLESKTGMTVFSQVKAAGTGSIIKQGDSYELGIDANGHPYFAMGDIRVTNDAVVNDGALHTIAGVKANNGIIKLYVDGSSEGATYVKENKDRSTTRGDILFAGGEFNKDVDEASAKIYDRALGYDEIAKLHSAAVPNLTDRNLAQGKLVSAKWTEDDTNAAKGQDRPMSMAVDGKKNDTENNYGEFGNDHKAASSYMEVDLGDVYELTELNLWRYWQGGKREYKDTLIVVSQDEKFGKKDDDASDDVIIFNADKDGKHGYVKGTQEGYKETADGHKFPVSGSAHARYVRVYMNGNVDNGRTGNTNHVVELEVIGHDLPKDPGASIDVSELYDRIDAVRAQIAAGKYTADSVQKVLEKLEAAELVADCPESQAAVGKALEDLNSIESQLKQAVTVTFEFKGDVPSGAQAPAPINVEKGTALESKLPTPDKVDGYSFKGWFSDADCTAGKEFKANTKVENDMTVYGKWVKDALAPGPGPDPQPTYVTVTFDDMVDGTDNKVVEVLKGSKVAKPEDPVREGYTFAGWYADEALTEAYDFGSAVNEDTVLYAKWTEDGGSEKPEPPVDPEDPNKPGRPEDPNKPVDPNKPGKPGADNKPGKPGLPQTGDNTLVAVGAASAAGIAMVAAGAVVYRRRKTQR